MSTSFFLSPAVRQNAPEDETLTFYICGKRCKASPGLLIKREENVRIALDISFYLMTQSENWGQCMNMWWIVKSWTHLFTGGRGLKAVILQQMSAGWLCSWRRGWAWTGRLKGENRRRVLLLFHNHSDAKMLQNHLGKAEYVLEPHHRLFWLCGQHSHSQPAH